MGLDKATLSISESQIPLLEFMQRKLRNLGFSQVWVSRNEAGFFVDKYPNCGPLGGIATALDEISNLDSAEMSGLLVVPVDMPLLEDEYLLRLIDEGLQGAEPTYYENQFLPAYFPANESIKETVKDTVTGSTNFSIRSILQKLNGRALCIDNQDAFLNANTPETWQKILSLIQHGGYLQQNGKH